MQGSAPHDESSSHALGLATLARKALRGEVVDHTTLPLRRSVVLLAVPMVMEMAMESLFAVADIFWVARLGADAVATVGLTESVVMLFYSIAIGLSLAATATVARRIGEGDGHAAAVAAGQVVLLAAAVSAALGAVGAVLAPELLRLMGASEGVLTTGTRYAQILLGGSVTVMLLFALNAIFRGVGDAATAMRSLWIANAVNIAAAPLLIFGAGSWGGMGVTGAAVATALGRGAGVAYQSVLLHRHPTLALRAAHLRPRWAVLTRLARLSRDGALQNLLETASWLALARILATFGSVAVAGYTIAMRIALLALLPSLGMANAAATLVGQNLGAARPERAERAVWAVSHSNLLFLGSVGLVFGLLPGELVGLFTDDPAELDYAASCLRIVSYGFVFYAYGMVLVQAFNGAGDTRTPTLLNVLAFWCFKLPLAWFLSVPLGLGPIGVFIAITAAYSGLALGAAALFRRGRWKLLAV